MFNFFRWIAVGIFGLAVWMESPASSVFDPTFRLDPAIGGRIETVRLRPDGRILIGGKLSLADGSTPQLVQVDDTGTLDPSFAPVQITTYRMVEHIPVDVAVLPDGRVLLSLPEYNGWFLGLAGDLFSLQVRSSSRIFCVSPDGREVTPWSEMPAYVRLTVTVSGKVVVWGTQNWTYSTGWFSRGFIERRLASGELDPEFSLEGAALEALVTPTGIESVSECLNGDLLVAGLFGTEPPGFSVPLPALLRVSPEGIVRWSLISPGNWIPSSYSREDAHGNIFTVGERGSLNRLNADGQADTESFDPPIFQPYGASLLLADGRLVVAGSLLPSAELSRRGLVCLENDGSVDLRFDPGLGFDPPYPLSQIRCLVEQPDGRILVGGSFTHFDGAAAAGLARLYPTNPGTPPSTNLFYFRALSGAAECGEPFRLRLIRAGDLQETHEVRVRTEPLTAENGVDFLPLDTNLVFLPGERFKTLTVPTISDRIAEEAETFQLHFEPIQPSVPLLGANPFLVAIVNQDCRAWFGATEISVVEGEPVTWHRAVAEVVVPSGVPVRIRSRDLTARAGIDYEPIDQLLVDSTTFALSTLDNTTVEGDRQFLVELVDEGKGLLFDPPQSLLVTIRDNDTPLGAARLISGEVRTLHSLPHRQWLLAGTFHRVDGVPRPGLARFNPDGTFDPSFDPPPELLASERPVESLPDGRVLMGGYLPPELDPKGLGILRLDEAGRPDPTFQLETVWDGSPNGRAASNRVSKILSLPNGALAIGGYLPRFSAGGSPAEVVQFSADGKRTGQWTLPYGFGRVRDIQTNGVEGLVAVSEWGVVRLSGEDTSEEIFGVHHPSWNNHLGPVCAVNTDVIWIETEPGGLTPVVWIPGRGPGFLGRPISTFTVGGQTIRAERYLLLQALSASRRLIGGFFSPVDGGSLGGFLLLVVDGSRQVVAASPPLANEPTGGWNSFALNETGEFAWVCSLPFQVSQPQWMRFSRELRPVADLSIEALSVQADGVFLRLRGQAPQGYSVEVSGDLQSWRTQSTSSEINWGQVLLDPKPTTEDSQRFYRLKY